MTLTFFWPICCAKVKENHKRAIGITGAQDIYLEPPSKMTKLSSQTVLPYPALPPALERNVTRVTKGNVDPGMSTDYGKMRLHFSPGWRLGIFLKLETFLFYCRKQHFSMIHGGVFISMSLESLEILMGPIWIRVPMKVLELEILSSWFLQV